MGAQGTHGMFIIWHFILDILFYAREITSIQNKRSPKTATMCIILINTHFTATL